MIWHELDRKTGVLLVQPGGPLGQEDFKSLAAAVDPYILETGPLKGLIIHVERFPGWENLVGLVEHLRFVKGHHRYIGKVALVTDSKLVRLMPRLAEHFVSAEISVFPFPALDAARQWVEEPDGV